MTGLTPEQILGIQHQQNVDAGTIAKMSQIPIEAALMQANLAKAQEKIPSMPVDTPYGKVMMTVPEAVEYANKQESLAASKEARAEANAIRREAMANAAESRAATLALSKGMQDLRRDQFASEKEFKEAKFVEDQKKDLNNVILKYAQSKKEMSPAPVVQAINSAPENVSPDLVVSKGTDAYTFHPSALTANVEGAPVFKSKQDVVNFASKQGLTVEQAIKAIIRKNSEVDPNFETNFNSQSTKLKGSMGWLESPSDVGGD